MPQEEDFKDTSEHGVGGRRGKGAKTETCVFLASPLDPLPGPVACHPAPRDCCCCCCCCCLAWSTGGLATQRLHFVCTLPTRDTHVDSLSSEHFPISISISVEFRVSHGMALRTSSSIRTSVTGSCSCPVDPSRVLEFQPWKNKGVDYNHNQSRRGHQATSFFL